ncbi:MAG: OmpH family outer membrane protein [Balneolaceae bacterium]|nr:OmpH family outer membrane protein [Balneolaceae bacterium]MDR9446684.1 OmpH family outer membrane protein [Balneolaceae bacterium]
MKTLLLSMLLGFVSLTTHAQSSVGIMNPQEVLAQLPETQAVEQQLQQFVAERQADFEARYTTWVQDVTTFQESVAEGELTSQAQQQEEQRLTQLQTELETLEQQFQADLQNRRAQLLDPILERMDVAMAQVAKEQDLSLVINKATAAGDPIVYFTSNNAVDITDAVVEQMNSSNEPSNEGQNE